MNELEDVCRVPVRFSEIDSMRRVWHGSYVTYFEDGRESFGRHYPGIGYADIQASGLYAPLYDLHVKFYAPLEINDVAIIHTRYVYKPGARLDYSYHIYIRRATSGFVPKEARCSCLSTPKGSSWSISRITTKHGSEGICSLKR